MDYDVICEEYNSDDILRYIFICPYWIQSRNVKKMTDLYEEYKNVV